MTVILLTSATGSPGVTTTALALALTWPRSVLLVDCDPDPCQAVLAGWLGAAPPATRGLVDLAQAHRQMVPLAPLLWQCTVPLVDSPRDAQPAAPSASSPSSGVRGTELRAGGRDAGRADGTATGFDNGELERRFLPGFTRPGAAAIFEPVWAELAQALAALAGGEADVLIDLGRLGPRGPAAPLLEIADVLTLVVRSSLRSLAASRLHLPMLREAVDGPIGPRWGFLVVGPGRPYTDSEVEREFSVPVLADFPWCPGEADVLIEGSPAPRRFMERPLMRAACAAATSLAAVGPRQSQFLRRGGPLLEAATEVRSIRAQPTGVQRRQALL